MVGQALILCLCLALAATTAVVVGAESPGPGGGVDANAGRPVERPREEPGVAPVIEIPAPTLRGSRRHRQEARDRTGPPGTGADRPGLAEAVCGDGLTREQRSIAWVVLYVERGHACEAGEDFEAAILEYQKAMAILSWYTDPRPFGITTKRLRELVENARCKAQACARRTGGAQLRAATLERERRRSDDAWKTVFISLDRNAAMAASCPLPEDRLEGIASRAPEQVLEGPPSGEAVLDLLGSRRVRSLTWEAADLDHVALYLRIVTGLGVSLTPGVRHAAFDEVEISLDVDDVTVATVLDLVTEPYELC